MENIVVCIILNKKNEILIQKKTMDYKKEKYKGMWALFGGGAESEDFEKEINRELMEETGIEFPVKFLFYFDFKREDMNRKCHVFSTKLDDVSKISLREGGGFAFFSKEELGDLELIPDCKYAIDLFFKKLDNGEIKNA